MKTTITGAHANPAIATTITEINNAEMNANGTAEETDAEIESGDGAGAWENGCGGDSEIGCSGRTSTAKRWPFLQCSGSPLTK